MFWIFFFISFFCILPAVPAVGGGGAPPVIWPHWKYVGIWTLQEAGAGRLPKAPFLWEWGEWRGCRQQELGGQPGHQPVTHKTPLKTEWLRRKSLLYVEQVNCWITWGFGCFLSYVIKAWTPKLLAPPPRRSVKLCKSREACFCFVFAAETKITHKRLVKSLNEFFLPVKASIEDKNF